MLTIIHDGINENIKQLIKFDMILCNKKTFIKTLKENSTFWEKFKRETIFGFYTPTPPKNITLYGYLFGVNEESECFEDGELAFMKDCQFISKYKDGKLRRIDVRKKI